MNCEQVNQIDMVEYLSSLGFQAKKNNGKDYSESVMRVFNGCRSRQLIKWNKIDRDKKFPNIKNSLMSSTICDVAFKKCRKMVIRVIFTI